MHFTWLDLIAPIGICLLSAALCIWGAIKGKAKDKIIAKIICIAVAVVFLAGIPAWYLVRGEILEPDYTTAHGIEVKEGVKNTFCNKDNVEKWTVWLFDFWSKHFDAIGVRKSIKGKLFVCVDVEELTVWGRSVRGYSHGKYSVAGYNGKEQYTESLFKHEMSHQIVDPFVPYSEKGHHDLFKEKKLGH